MVIFDDGDIRFLVLILKLILAIILTVFFLILILILLVRIALAFFLFLLQLCLFLQFADSLPLSDLVVTDDALPHLVILGIDELTQDLLLFFIFLFELLVENLDLADFCGELQEGGLKVVLVVAEGRQLLHQLHVVSLHVPENYEFLGEGQDLHLDQVQIALELVFYLLQGRQLSIELVDL